MTNSNGFDSNRNRKGRREKKGTWWSLNKESASTFAFNMLLEEEGVKELYICPLA